MLRVSSHHIYGTYLSARARVTNYPLLIKWFQVLVKLVEKNSQNFGVRSHDVDHPEAGMTLKSNSHSMPSRSSTAPKNGVQNYQELGSG